MKKIIKDKLKTKLKAFTIIQSPKDYPDEYTTYHRVIVDWTSDEEKKCQKKNKIQAVFMCILLLSLLTIFYFIVRFLAL
jgi:hypothetical protein